MATRNRRQLTGSTHLPVVRVAGWEREYVELAARVRGLSLTEFIRRAVSAAAAQALTTGPAEQA